MAQYREMASFAQFASDLDQSTKNLLARGARLTEMLKQPQYKPMPVEEQVVIIYAATRKHLLDIKVEDVLAFEKGLFDFIQTRYSEIPETIKTEKVLTEEMEEKLVKAIAEFKEEFNKED